MFIRIRKEKALIVGILSTVTTISLYTNNHNPYMWLFFVLAIAFFGTAFHKYQRDDEIIANARKERAEGAQISQTMPEVTSKGSRRLFVPPPIND
jgi:phosphoribulokinase